MLSVVNECRQTLLSVQPINSGFTSGVVMYMVTCCWYTSSRQHIHAVQTAETDIQHCVQYITNIPRSVLTGDVNAHSTFWHSYTDDHRGQLIADDISNSDHITINTNTPTRVPSTTLQQTSSPYITTVSNTLYNRTSWTTQHALSPDHLPIITTINIRYDYRLQQNRRTFTNFNWTQFAEDTHTHQHTQPT